MAFRFRGIMYVWQKRVQLLEMGECVGWFGLVGLVGLAGLV